MTSEAREKRLRLVAKKKAEQLKAALTSLEPFQFARPEEFPDWIHEELRKIRLTSSTPDATLPEETNEETLRSWMKSFTDGAGIGERFYIGTGNNHFPWLDCQIRDQNWLDNIVDTLGHEVTLISHDKTLIVAIYEEEYEYQAFNARSDRRRDPSGAVLQ